MFIKKIKIMMYNSFSVFGVVPSGFSKRWERGGFEQSSKVTEKNERRKI